MSEAKKKVTKKKAAKKAVAKEAVEAAPVVESAPVEKTLLVISRHRGNVILPSGSIIKPDSAAKITEADKDFLELAKVRYKVVEGA